MEYIFSEPCLQHFTGNHPENPMRLEVFLPFPPHPLELDEAPVHLIHTKSYIEKVKQACAQEMPLDADTRTSKKSFQAAIAAVAATIEASHSGGFALVRPPGHHAYPDRGTGFCLFNSIAVATQRLVQQGKRVLILDFDGHLGDGTEHIFYQTDKVLFWSLHQFPAFPGKGFADEIGKGKGKGFTINVPLPPSSGDDIFWHAFETYLPVAKQFEPDVVAVSAGFDAHIADLLLDLRLTNHTFYKIGKTLGIHFENIFATLEGGYNLQWLPVCAHNFLAGINREAPRIQEKETTSAQEVWSEYSGRLKLGTNALKPFWHI